MKEVWKDVEESKGMYQVSNLGRIKSIKRIMSNGRYKNKEIILKQHISKKGYYRLSIYTNCYERKTMPVHRLVAKAFIENPLNKPQINHKDGNKLNNNVSNLEWATNSENQLHANRTGLNNNRLKRIVEACSKQVIQYNLNNQEIARYNSAREAERKTGISYKIISYYCIHNVKKPKKHNCYFKFN